MHIYIYVMQNEKNVLKTQIFQYFLHSSLLEVKSKTKPAKFYSMYISILSYNSMSEMVLFQNIIKKHSKFLRWTLLRKKNVKRNITTWFFIVYFLKCIKNMLISIKFKILKKNIIRQEDTKAGNIIKSSFIKNTKKIVRFIIYELIDTS